MADSTVKAVVTGVDIYRWVDEDGATQEAERGQEITVSAKELERGQKMDPPALAKAGSKEAKAAAKGDAEPPAQPATTPAGEPIDGVEVEPGPEPVTEQQ